MFVGHYGPAAAVADGRVKLWHAFVAVQFHDILWAPFILMGVEKVRIVENFTASNHFDLHYMPYSHSLVMAVVWSVLGAFVYAKLRPTARKAGAILIGCLIFSHWVLDYITHTPDLALWFDGPKVGLGLWNNLPLALGAEIALLGAGLIIYLSRTQAKGALGTVAPLALVVLLLGAQLFGNFGPPPASAAQAAQSAIAAYGIAAALAAMVDYSRKPRSRPA